MALTVTSTGQGTFEQAPVGTHVARCVKIIDIGTQHGEYQGKKTTRKQIIVGWELPTEKMEDGRPFVVSKFYTASLNEKATLRHDLEAWRGRAFTDEELAKFDLRAIIGKPCMIAVVDKGGKSRVGSVMALVKGMPVPDQVNESFTFDIDEWNDIAFQKLSDGIKEMVKQSDEYKKRHSPKSDFDDFESDIPWREPGEDVAF